jgi:succinate dehydrogenase / fumarate reductase membrane anchor subunit
MFSNLGHGSKEFLIIRACAVLMLIYTLYLGGFVLLADEVNFNQWSAFFDNTLNKIFTSLFFLAFAIHTWLGTWAVASDYLTPRIFGNFGRIMNVSFRGIVAAIIALVLTWAVIIIW